MEREVLIYCKHRTETTEKAAKIARENLAGQGVTRKLWPISATCLYLAAKMEVLMLFQFFLKLCC
jgi:hypothetical protein